MVKKDVTLKENSKIFKMNSFEVIIMKVNCCFKKYKEREGILKIGEKKMFFYLDVMTYLKKMQELDVLKYILLSADQLFLFNFLSKPALSTSDITNSVYKEFEFEQRKPLSLTKDEIKQIHECYGNILNQNTLNNLDKKLVNLIDAEIEGMKID